MRILIADDQHEVRFALRVLLDRQPGLTVINDTADADSLLARTEAACPDVLLLDWELPGLSVESLSVLRELCPALLVIALSGRPEMRSAALSAGVDAFVSKADPPEALLEAVDHCRWIHTDQDGPGPKRTTDKLD